MTTTWRFYHDLAGTNDVSPAMAAVWTGGASRAQISTTPPGQSGTYQATDTAAAPVSMPLVQGVSDPLTKNRLLSGSMRRVLRISTVGGATASNPTGGIAQAKVRSVLKVVSNDGLTLRGVLGTWDSSILIFNATNVCSRLVSGVLTPVAAQAGDRIVEELGAFYNNTSTTSFQASFTPTNVGSSSDLPYVEGDTSTQRSWLELILDDTVPPMYLGDTQVDALYLGDTPVDAAALGAVLL